MSVAALVCLTGCPRANVDLLEGRLREQEQQLANVRSELNSTRNELNVTRQEADALRSQIQMAGGETLLPEQAQALYRAAGISFNSLLTSGVDQDGQPGHEELSILLTPHDADGELVKLPGAIELAVIDPSQPEGQQTIGRWQFDVEQSKDHWHRGFIGSGYQFDLPWPSPPQSRQLVLHGRLTTTDGRQFDTSQILEIEPPVSSVAEPRRIPEPLDLTHSPPIERRYRPDVSLPEWTEPPAKLNNSAQVQTSDNWTDATIPRYR